MACALIHSGLLEVGALQSTTGQQKLEPLTPASRFSDATTTRPVSSFANAVSSCAMATSWALVSSCTARGSGTGSRTGTGTGSNIAVDDGRQQVKTLSYHAPPKQANAGERKARARATSKRRAARTCRYRARIACFFRKMTACARANMTASWRSISSSSSVTCDWSVRHNACELQIEGRQMARALTLDSRRATAGRQEAKRGTSSRMIFNKRTVL